MKVWIGETFEKTIDGEKITVIDIYPDSEKPSDKIFQKLVYKWV
ncbi:MULTISPECIES: hypothetical protein [Fictibacillus]|uniref:Uncharacterized protein n=1 Tax=Fictibacillus terranigra TaxID=3058424 RepID=A0ABT8E2U7_9BACL|nr:hypothetical protein [Fictibacillus sp. CENA-BCM004]MDN4072222.1 hypothetical protein [Fictibacillus sp. CENA-BCM004]